MHRHGVVAAVGIRLAVPGSEPLDELESSRGRIGLVLVERIAATELEAGDHQAAGVEMAGAPGDEPRLGSRWGEQRHVPGHHDEIEGAVEVELGEVLLTPVEVGCPPARRVDHRGVGVDTDHLDAVVGQLDRHAARATAGIEHVAGW